MQVIPLRLSSFQFCDSFSQKLRIEEPLKMAVAAKEESIVDHPTQENEDESDRKFAFAPDGDGEFSFAPNGEDSSQISAEEIFSDGLIRPVFPFFNRDILFSGDEDEARVSGDSPSSPLRQPLKKLFSEQPPAREKEEDSPAAAAATEIDGPCCEWSASSTKEVVETSPGVCKKSNSTGFSKLWKFRDLVNRSSSDGKDAFVFFNNPSPAAEMEGGKKTESSPALSSDRRKNGEGGGRGGTAAVVGERKVRARGPKGETASSAYMRKREVAKAKEKEKRRSYLPYRQDLLGFFTNVNGLSKNVHPF